MSNDRLVAEFFFTQRIHVENAICLVLSITIGAEIKMIETLQVDTPLYLVEHQSHGVRRMNW